MKIILSGGGDPQDVVPIDQRFLSMLDLKKTVLYIPIAMEPEDHPYNECLSWFQSVYRPYGIQHIEMCTDLSAVSLDGRYTAVFIGGGNTFKLLNDIRASRFDVQLLSYLQNGGLLYGGSAGAIICGKTIATAAHLDENKVGLADWSGLNLLGGYDIFCHYTPQDDAVLGQYAENLYILSEDAGLVCEDGIVSGVGAPYLTKTK